MNFVKTTLLLGAMTGLLLAIGQLLGGRSGMTLALVMAGVMNFAALFFCDKIVLRMYSAKPVGPEDAPEFYAIVQGLAQRANIPMPRLYVIPDRALNAFATGRSPSHAAVAATVGHPARDEPRRARRRPGPRAVARDQPRHARLHRGRHPGRRDLLAGPSVHVPPQTTAKAAIRWWRWR